MIKSRLAILIRVITELKAKKLDEIEPSAGTPDRPEDAFWMGGWGRKSDSGTVGCLGGWLTQDPEAQAEGLSAFGLKDGFYVLVPCFGHHTDFTALRYFFELDSGSVSHIFNSWNTNSLDDALARVELVMAGADDDDLYDQRDQQRRREREAQAA